MGAFQAGFGMGQKAYNDAMAWQDRALERERQAKLDAQNAETHAQQKRLNQNQLDEQERDRAGRQAYLDAAEDATVEPIGMVTDAAGKAFVQPDAGAAQAAIDQARLEGDTGEYQAGQGFGVRTGAGTRVADSQAGGMKLAGRLRSL
jgi:hypothetical protein